MPCQDLRVTKTGNYPVVLIPRADLIAHEKTVPENTDKVKSDIMASGILHFPVVVEKKSNIILDGHHRFEALGQMDIDCIPCYIIDVEDKSVFLTARRKDIPVNKQTFVNEVLVRKDLFPPKTTKFEFFPPLEAVDLPIKDFA